MPGMFFYFWARQHGRVQDEWGVCLSFKVKEGIIEREEGRKRKSLPFLPLEIEHRTLCMQTTHSTTEIHPKLLFRELLAHISWRRKNTFTSWISGHRFLENYACPNLPCTDLIIRATCTQLWRPHLYESARVYALLSTSWYPCLASSPEMLAWPRTPSTVGNSSWCIISFDKCIHFLYLLINLKLMASDQISIWISGSM